MMSSPTCGASLEITIEQCDESGFHQCYTAAERTFYQNLQHKWVLAISSDERSALTKERRDRVMQVVRRISTKPENRP
jgi:hypothetical protein